MLPGFRFLFAATVLSMSVLIFGLGAAALLRAAHEQFASIPLRRGPPEMVFPQPVETIPTLALLRVDTPDVESAPDQVAASEPIPVAAPAIEPETVAAPSAENPAPPDAANPEITVAEAKSSGEAAAPAQAGVGPADEEIKPAGVTEASQPEASKPEPANDAVASGSDQTIVPVVPDAALATTKLAALGGVAATVEEKTSAQPSNVKPDRSTIRKRLRAQRAKERRRIAARRARAARLALQQQQQPPPTADPFGQPAIATRTR